MKRGDILAVAGVIALLAVIGSGYFVAGNPSEYAVFSCGVGGNAVCIEHERGIDRHAASAILRQKNVLGDTCIWTNRLGRHTGVSCVLKG